MSISKLINLADPICSQLSQTVMEGFVTVFVDNLSSAYCLDSDSQDQRSYCCNLRSVATDTANAQQVNCNDSIVQSFDAQDHSLDFLNL